MNEDISKAGASQQEDAGLVKAFQSGDKTVFDKIVLKYKDKVFNLCYRFLGDHAEADDCAQESFVKVYCSLQGFRLESTFSTWLYRLTVNTCKNKLGSLEYRYRKKMVRLNNPKETEEGTNPVEIRDESLSPIIEIERKEKEMLIQKAIDSLPEEQKTVVVLRDIEGLSYEEIVKITGYKLGTLKSKLARARSELRKKLRGVI